MTTGIDGYSLGSFPKATGSDETYLTMGEVSRRLSMGRKTLLRAVAQGDLMPAVLTPRGHPRFLAADVTAYAAHLAGTANAVAPRVAKPARTQRLVSKSQAPVDDMPAREVVTGLLRLASLGLNTGPDVDAGILAVLALLADTLDAGVTFLARVEGQDLHIERAYDRIAMGLTAGDVIPLRDSY